MDKYTHETETALFAQAQAGDAQSVAVLMARHANLVHTVVRRQWSGGWAYADIVQEGRIGLWHALLKYDPTRGVAFSTYAGVAIAHQVWAAVRQEARRETAEGQPDPAGMTEDVHTHVVWRQVCRTLRQMVAALPEKERWLVARYYGLDGRGGTTQAVLGAQLGCTRQAIGYHLRKATLRLRHPAWSALLRAWLAYNQRQDYWTALRPPRRRR
jgi:RNA polymerase sigma factor (sigma-70 family)